MSTHTEHAESPKAEAVKYAATLFVLLILTAITVGASYINFGSGNIVIALTIATIKASIVGLIFMHLLHDKPVNAMEHFTQIVAHSSHDGDPSPSTAAGGAAIGGRNCGARRNLCFA